MNYVVTLSNQRPLHDSVEVIDISSFTYSGAAQDFEKEKYGYKMHFPDEHIIIIIIFFLVSFSFAGI